MLRMCAEGVHRCTLTCVQRLVQKHSFVRGSPSVSMSAEPMLTAG